MQHYPWLAFKIDLKAQYNTVCRNATLPLAGFQNRLKAQYNTVYRNATLPLAGFQNRLKSITKALPNILMGFPQKIALVKEQIPELFINGTVQCLTKMIGQVIGHTFIS